MSGSGTGEDEPKSERFNMFMSPSELTAIDEWAWKNRVRSKSEAVRRLCQIAIRTQPQIDELNDMVGSALLKSESVYKEWEHLLDEEDDIKYYAYKLAILTGDNFVDIHRSILDVAIRIAGLVKETNTLTGSSDILNAIRDADALRTQLDEAEAKYQERFDADLREAAQAIETSRQGE